MTPIMLPREIPWAALVRGYSEKNIATKKKILGKEIIKKVDKKRNEKH